MALVKNKKKLGLARETIRQLSRHELTVVMAASFNSTCMGAEGSGCCPQPNTI